MPIAKENYNLENDDVIGARTRIRHPSFNLGTYATNGQTGLKALCGFTQVHNVVFHPLTNGSIAYDLRYDYDTDKIVVYTSGSQVSNATDLSAIKFRATVFGF